MSASHDEQVEFSALVGGPEEALLGSGTEARDDGFKRGAFPGRALFRMRPKRLRRLAEQLRKCAAKHKEPTPNSRFVHEDPQTREQLRPALDLVEE